MLVLMVFETITEVICASLEVASHIYVCFTLWHAIIIMMLCLTYFRLYAHVPFVTLIFNAPSVHMVCKDKTK
jgi:hypothetical protein